VQHTLSVLLPVRDAQATLSAQVRDHLDLATDLGGQFELLIIDDGSADATCEVAHELRHDYPQIRVVRHEMSQGREAAIRTGLERSRGETVVVREENGRFCIFRRQPPGQQAASRPARPNYLSRLRNFVLSE
jgi:glycosyltransferase involved in cell wall biosynthesis